MPFAARAQTPTDPPTLGRPAEPAAPGGVAWNPAWTKFTLGEHILTGSMLLGTGAIILFTKKNGVSNWRGGILFDDDVRAGLRASTPEGRRTAQLIGDATYYSGLAYPLLVDAAAVTWLGHQNGEVAAQMALMDAEAYSITGFLSFVSNATIRRERPFVRECGPGKPDQVFPDCVDDGPTESFYSGHTGIAFTGAALTCMHHAHLPLYGRSGVGGAIVCASMMGAAAAGGVSRIVADKHYVSDVVVGAAIGLASGLLVPWFHYRHAGAVTVSERPLPAIPMALLFSEGGGVGAAGVF